MGYWRASATGESLQVEDTGLIWGDRPADIMDQAIRDILDVFQEDRDRDPTEAEIRAGLLFSLRDVALPA